MKKKTKKAICISIIVLCISVIVSSILFYSVYLMFFDIQRFEGQKKIAEVSSPNDKYMVTAYLNSGGATTGWAVLGTVTYKETGETKNIYWNYRCEEADIYWVDEKTVNINGEELNVLKDIYDFRRE